MFSILHISDIHRSPDEPVNNDTLVALLVNDCDRYMGETPMVPAPHAVVVSGDIIQGVGVGVHDWQDSVRVQYEVASDFLDHLVRRFINGDRSRLILAPGNHDVCWNTSFRTMKKVPEAEYPKNISAALTGPDSVYKWSWHERALYRVIDLEGYTRRLDAYWDFVTRFYAGVPMVLPLDRNRGFQLSELDQRRIVIAAFDSLHGNDCFAYGGGLEPGAIGRCYLALRDRPRAYFLRIGVWHHSIQARPPCVDYMDVGQVHEMAGHGFQLGLHGHQHIAATATHYVHLTANQAMAVVGAGSLCAGARELPRGVNRQYNVIVIDDDYRHARVHIRQMAEGGHFVRKSGGGFAQGYVELGWQAPVDTAGREIIATIENERRATTAAGEALQTGDAHAALALLDGLSLAPGTHARVVAIEAARRSGDWERLATIIGEPKRPDEVVLLVSALEHLGEFDRGDAVLAANNDLDPSIRNEMKGRLAARRMMRGA